MGRVWAVHCVPRDRFVGNGLTPDSGQKCLSPYHKVCSFYLRLNLSVRHASILVPGISGPKVLERPSKVLERPSKILERPSKVLERPSKVLERPSKYHFAMKKLTSLITSCSE